MIYRNGMIRSICYRIWIYIYFKYLEGYKVASYGGRPQKLKFMRKGIKYNKIKTPEKGIKQERHFV